MNTETTPTPQPPPAKRTRTVAAIPPPEVVLPKHEATAKKLPVVFETSEPKVNWVCQIKTKGILFGILCVIGEVQPDHLWLYLLGKGGAKQFFKVRPSDVQVIGPAWAYANEVRKPASGQADHVLS